MTCVIARHINGISLNGYEYVLDDEGKIMKFVDKKQAVRFLINNGATDEEIHYLRFLDYEKLKN